MGDTNNMKFNDNKFELLRYGKEPEIKSVTTYKSYDDLNINDKEQVRDLGIMMSNTATFTLHIRNIVKKDRDKMGYVLRVFQSRQRSLMLTLLNLLSFPLYRVLLAASSCTNRSYSTNVYIQNQYSAALKLLGKTSRTQIILSPETQ